jgi:hypothetical protein
MALVLIQPQTNLQPPPPCPSSPIHHYHIITIIMITNIKYINEPPSTSSVSEFTAFSLFIDALPHILF